MYHIHKRAYDEGFVLVDPKTNKYLFIDNTPRSLLFAIKKVTRYGWTFDDDVGDYFYSITPETHPEYFI